MNVTEQSLQSRMARYQPPLLAGLFIGVLSMLPLVNLCCCLWVVLGGMLAVYLQQQTTPDPIGTSSAALSGLLAGTIGGLILNIGQIVISRIIGLDEQQAVSDFLALIPELPAEMADQIRWVAQSPAFRLAQAIVSVLIYAVFSMLGALLGTVFFRRKPSPDAPAGPGPVV